MSKFFATNSCPSDFLFWTIAHAKHRSENLTYSYQIPYLDSQRLQMSLLNFQWRNRFRRVLYGRSCNTKKIMSRILRMSYTFLVAVRLLPKFSSCFFWKISQLKETTLSTEPFSPLFRCLLLGLAGFFVKISFQFVLR